jgi:PBP1b-binding outer membrane lipoprotein LpoB
MIKYLFLFSLLFLTTACDKEPKPSIYKDSKTINLTSIRWGKEDLQELSKKMVQSILIAKSIDFSKEKSYHFESIRNDTHDQIDTDMLQDKITTSLIKSSKFTFIKKEQKRTNYIFKGKISSIFKKNSRTKDMFFSFNLTLINAQTSAFLWSEDIEIRKLYKKSLFSW